MDNPVILRYYQDIPVIKGNENDDYLPFDMDDFSSMCIEAVYVIDFLKRRFRYVADHEFFLCGHSVDEVMELGYEFYQDVIYGADLPSLEEMHAAILRRLCGMNDDCGINYFSFTVRIKNDSDVLMAHHKIKPVFIDGNIRFGICLLTSSILRTPGHLRAYYYKSSAFEEYNTNTGQWKRRIITSLTLQEKTILKLGKQGKSGKEIAEHTCMSYQALRNAEEAIYRKLNVHSMIQAIIFATNHRLIFTSEQHPANLKHAILPEGRRQRRPMTSEMLLRIQEKLNSGQSVNSIARQENIGEYTIRYAITTGKLKKQGNKFGNLSDIGSGI